MPHPTATRLPSPPSLIGTCCILFSYPSPSTNLLTLSLSSSYFSHSSPLSSTVDKSPISLRHPRQIAHLQRRRYSSKHWAVYSTLWLRIEWRPPSRHSQSHRTHPAHSATHLRPQPNSCSIVKSPSSNVSIARQCTFG